MKFLFKRLLPMAVLFLCLGVLASCEEKVKLEPYALDDGYSIVRGDTAEQAEIDAAILLFQALGETPLATDFVKRGEAVPEAGKEILVGATNRAESVEAAESLKINDFVIKRVGERILILGGSPTATEAAASYFIENCIKDGNLLLPPEGSEYVYHADYSVETLTLQGHPIVEYQIALEGRANAYDTAVIKHFISELSQLCGWKLTLADSIEESSAPMLVIQTANVGDENSWKIETAGDQLVVSRNGEFSLSAALHSLLDRMTPENGEKKVDVTITDTLSEHVSTEPLVSFNLPETYAAMTLSSAEDGGVWEAFTQAVSELPEEVTVLERFDPNDYPESMRNQIFVSPDGNDHARGTLDDPLRTPQAALDRIAGAGGGVIWLRGGVYTLQKPLSFDLVCSGSDAAPTFLCAYQEEEVTLTAGYLLEREAFTAPSNLSELSPSAAEHILVCDLMALGIKKSEYGQFTTSSRPILLADEKAQTIARYPNLGEAELVMGEVIDVGKVTDAFSKLYEENKDKTGGWVLTLEDDRPKNWKNTQNIWVYGAFFAEWNRQHYPVTFDFEAGTMSSSQYLYLGAQWKADNTFYYYNILDELDAPGEWYLDSNKGLLYFYPEEDFESAMLVTTQNTLITVSNAKNIIFSNLTMTGTMGIGVSVSNSEQIVLQDCEIVNCGQNGVRITQSKRCGVLYSTFTNNGDGQCQIEGGDRSQLIPEQNFIQNCTFSGESSKSGTYTGGVAVILSHNYYDGQQAFISTSNESIIEYNEFFRGPNTKDAGMIYLNGRYLSSRGNHIRYNYFHNMEVEHAGVYIDDCAGGQYIYGNIVDVVNADTENYSLKMTYRLHNGRECVFYNNISIGATNAAFSDNANYYAGYLSWPSIRRSSYESGKELMASEAFVARYPLYATYYEKLAQNEEEAQIEGYERNALEDEVLEPAYNIYQGNLIINAVEAFKLSDVGKKTAIGLEQNYISKDSPLDRSYQVIDDAVYELLPDYQNVPFDKMGLIEK